MVCLYPKAVFVRPIASGRGVALVELPDYKILLFVLLLNAVLYIFDIYAMATAWFCYPPLAIIAPFIYSLFGVIPLPIIALFRIYKKINW